MAQLVVALLLIVLTAVGVMAYVAWRDRRRARRDIAMAAQNLQATGAEVAARARVVMDAARSRD